LVSRHPELDAGAVLGIAEGLDLVLISDNEVLIQFGLRSRPSELLRDQDVSGLLGRTIGQILRGPATVGELLALARPGQESDVRALLEDLVERGILADTKSSPVEQYIRYTFTGQPHLANGRIAMIGAGPLGARVAQDLVQHGITGLTLLDDRPIGASWRAYAPFRLNDSQDGMRADVALCESLGPAARALDAGLNAAGIEEAMNGADLTVLALEQPDLRTAHLVNRYAIRERTPWLLATIDGNFGMVGPLFFPVETACYNDYRTLTFAATPNRGMARKHREYLLERRGTGSFFAGLPSYVEIVAGHTSLAAVHFLLRGACFALGRVMVIDFDRMQIDVEDVLKLPRCPVCGTQKNAYRPPVSTLT
jgi:bacteriocin biosynthesis cyclodehydratase domain-containing protein